MWFTQQKKGTTTGKRAVRHGRIECFKLFFCGWLWSSTVILHSRMTLEDTALGLGSDEASWLDIKSDVQKVKNEVDLGHSLGDFCTFVSRRFVFVGKKQKKQGQCRLGVNNKSRSWMFWKSTWAFEKWTSWTLGNPWRKWNFLEWELPGSKKLTTCILVNLHHQFHRLVIGSPREWFLHSDVVILCDKRLGI